MTLQDLYQKAISFAAIAHKNQMVPGKQYSYVVHFSEVAMEVMLSQHDDGTGPASDIDLGLALQCALLHDTLEDTETTYDQLKEAFGWAVADGVLALTKNKDLDKPLQMVDSLRRIVLQPKEIHMVKMADRITNLQEPPSHWTPEKIRSYQNEARLIYDYLKDCCEFLARRLEIKIEDYDAYINN